jgi:hypothetical protein
MAENGVQMTDRCACAGRNINVGEVSEGSDDRERCLRL